MEANIRLEVCAKGGRSYIKSLYVTPPFRLISVGQLACDGALYLMQMTTSPGVLSGDRYDIEVSVDSGASLQLKSQSYQRIYDMEGEASQYLSIDIGDDAHFSQVPHPIVPHRNSSFTSHTKVNIGERSSFLQSEIITCGRKYHGEEFEFRLFANNIEVRSGGHLRFMDRLRLTPSTTPLRGCGLLEGATHQGTLIFQTTEECDVSVLMEEVYQLLESHKEINFGVSLTHHKGFVLRALGRGGEALFNAFCCVQQYIWDKREIRYINILILE
ncbi:MAG: urease accessory protein UreD [Rikenellaceae bacterium]